MSPGPEQAGRTFCRAAPGTRHLSSTAFWPSSPEPLAADLFAVVVDECWPPGCCGPLPSAPAANEGEDVR